LTIVCGNCGFGGGAKLFAYNPTLHVIACPRCHAQKNATPEEHAAFVALHGGSERVGQAPVDPNAPQADPASFLGHVMPSDVRAAKEKLSTVIVPLYNSLASCPQVPNAMRVAFTQFYTGFGEFYQAVDSPMTSGDSIKTADQFYDGIRDWQIKISQYCDPGTPVLPPRSIPDPNAIGPLDILNPYGLGRKAGKPMGEILGKVKDTADKATSAISTVAIVGGVLGVTLLILAARQTAQNTAMYGGLVSKMV
jgi:hypothetical protein